MKIQDYPKRIVIELTPECNLSCRMCPRKYIKDKSGYILKNLWVRLVNEIAEYFPGSVIIPFWRGESILHPDFRDLIELALRSSLRVHIATNGVLLDDADFKLLSGCEFVTFSIHTILGYNNAKKFLKFRNGKHSITQASFVEGEKTTKEICLSIIDSPDLEGFDSVRVYAEHTKDGIFGSFGKTIGAKRVFCPKLQDTLVIAYDGTISRCNHIWETEKEISVNDISIREVWNSKCLQQIRENYPDQKCEPCGQWTGHTCGELWQNENGKIKHSTFGLEN